MSKEHAETVQFEANREYGPAIRVDHVTGVSDFLINLASSRKSLDGCFCFFDFDRLLTNGFDSQEKEASPIEKRIRGGTELLKGLSNCLEKGAELFVVTARSPTVITIQQLQASLQNPQKELAEFFLDFKKAGEVIDFSDYKFASNNRLFATGYHKESAIAYIVDKLALKNAELFFFDDAVTNCYSVASNWRKLLPKPADKVILTSVWADPFFEETEVEGQATMVPVHSESSDFNYHTYLKAQLEYFGIDNATATSRRDVYLAEEKKYGRKPPKTKADPPPEAKKMENVEKKFAGLAGLFGKKG